MAGSNVEVVFSVNCETRGDDHLCLVGDAKCLGAWNACKGIPMERNNGNSEAWSVTLSLKTQTTYEYRFYVCQMNHMISSEDSFTPFSVVKWETNIKPREITTTSGGKQELPVATFGQYGDSCNVGKGWLINQSEVQIRLHSNPIHMWKAKHQMQSYSVKCMAMDYAATEGMTVNMDEDSRDGPAPCTAEYVLVSALSESECKPTTQSPCGQQYKENDYLVFRTQIPNLLNVGFQLDFYVYEENDPSKYVGSSHILPINFPETRQNRKLPIIGYNHKPIGKVAVDILVARPVPGLDMSMEHTYQTHWKYRELGTKSLDIGHRGMGISYTQFNMLKENTIASFASAASHGADFVEFDVLLSKDMQPVIYHDFSVHVSYTSNLFSSGEEKVELNDDEDDVLNTQPFPTLERCLREVDESMGFNMEIKYPQQDENDQWEAENYIDLNDNLDHILKVLFAHAGNRKIILSCFDPDACILLQLKQNKFPVMFLNQGQSKKWVPYKDYRANKFRNGIKFASSEHLLGVVLLSESVFRDLSIIEFAKSEKMVVFVWGDENNDPHAIRWLRERGVDGIIYDRIDRHKPEHQPEFELQSRSDEEIFKAIVNSVDNTASMQVKVSE